MRSLLALGMGDTEDALQLAQEMMTIQKQVRSHNHPFGFMCLGNALLAMESFEQAQVAFANALAHVPQNNVPVWETTPRTGLAEVAYHQGEWDIALAEVEWLLAHLDHEQLYQYTMDHFRTHWVCYQVFAALNDPRKEDVLAQSHRQLQLWANRLGDETLYTSFLQNIAANQKIMKKVGC